MKSVAIFRFAPTEGPGYFGTYLERHGVSWDLIKVDEGDAVPADPVRYAGLVFMGGPMSVNDDLPWIPGVLQLIRDAVSADIPVLGHCLGGQLMSRALGGAVTRNPIKEIGWGQVRVSETEAARTWFGHAAPSFVSFHWHGETFSIPPGGDHILGNDHCVNQAFVMNDRHLAMQCHIEMTREMIDAWCLTGAREIERSASPAVQPAATIKAEIVRGLPELHRVADGVYQRWVENLRS